jgi:murein DD-endopeptidase MepM/ murein hydrolase activator NlpD
MRMLVASCCLLLPLSSPADACALADAESAVQLKRPVTGVLTHGFGMRTHPILMIKKMHTGTDWSAEPGTPVHASAGGEVAKAGREGEYGNLVVIRHGSGVETAYAHLKRIDVKEGDCVEQGAVIGGVGATGLASTTQLHFEVRRNGRLIDPRVALGDDAHSSAAGRSAVIPA